MKVTLAIKTDSNPTCVEVRCTETWTAVQHFDDAIKTLRVARAWFLKQGEKPAK